MRVRTFEPACGAAGDADGTALAREAVVGRDASNLPAKSRRAARGTSCCPLHRCVALRYKTCTAITTIRRLCGARSSVLCAAPMAVFLTPTWPLSQPCGFALGGNTDPQPPFCRRRARIRHEAGVLGWSELVRRVKPSAPSRLPRGSWVTRCPPPPLLPWRVASGRWQGCAASFFFLLKVLCKRDLWGGILVVVVHWGCGGVGRGVVVVVQWARAQPVRRYPLGVQPCSPCFPPIGP